MNAHRGVCSFETSSRWWITSNGEGGGGGRTLSEAIEMYALSLRFAEIPYAYRGGPYRWIGRPCR